MTAGWIGVHMFKAEIAPRLTLTSILTSICLLSICSDSLISPIPGFRGYRPGISFPMNDLTWPMKD
jgi:hypothetical protein